MSSFRRGFANLDSAQLCRTSRIWEPLCVISGDKDTEMSDCVSGFDSYVTVTLYRRRGNGGGADNVSS